MLEDIFYIAVGILEAEVSWLQKEYFLVEEKIKTIGFRVKAVTRDVFPHSGSPSFDTFFRYFRDS